MRYGMAVREKRSSSSNTELLHVAQEGHSIPNTYCTLLQQKIDDDIPVEIEKMSENLALQFLEDRSFVYTRTKFFEEYILLYAHILYIRP